MALILVYIIILGGSFNKPVWAQYEGERGITDRLIEEGEWIEVGTAPDYVKPAKPEYRKLQKSYRISGSQQATYDLDSYIPAGDHLAVRFDYQNQTLNIIQPEPANPFSANVRAAIDKAPRWMENDLITIFSLLESAYQEKWANAILDAEDPYIDEIAFCIAHLSPQYLMSEFAYVELLNLNARLVYENDPYLDYVDVIDYGSSQTDPDYYTTTKYRKSKFIDTVEVEVPKEIYYWYIVHPKISDEIPAFIDPDIPEYTHRDNITGPEDGYFWREFLFYRADPGYAAFKDLIKGRKVVWNSFSGNPRDTHAIEVMNRWQSRSMTFDSDNERPHQPVRIYTKHKGRCGENADMRVAIARSALIPATGVGTYSRDHVWNEFWDEEWIHWDGPINDPLMYVDDWGKELNSVFQWRSDGAFTSVTDRYTRKYATLNIFATDSASNPIDGALVVLYAPGLYQDRAFDNYGVTDKDGKVTFIVGAGRTYWARMSCDYGRVPSGNNEVMRVVGTSQHNETYNVQMSINAKKPVFRWDDIPVPQFDDARYYLEVDVNVPSQILWGRSYIDDMVQTPYHFIKKDGGHIDFFISDPSNYQSYLDNQEFQGFYSMIDSGNALCGFEFDEGSDWYAVFDNSNALYTLQHISGSVNLYSVYDPEIADVNLLSNFPNPVKGQNRETTIIYELPYKTKVEITLYNVLGQKVRTLVNEFKYAGQFRTSWDGKNEAGHPVTSGTYLCRIKTDRGEDTRKIMIIH